VKCMVYCSVACRGLGSDDVFEIVRHSSKWNSSRGVSELLLYDRGRFLQLLEGGGDPTIAIEEFIAKSGSGSTVSL